MKRLHIATVLLCIVLIVISIWNRPARETIMFFPIDPSVKFIEAKTTLALQHAKKKETYTIDWTVTSTLDRNAYLRQDVSLLFANGRLFSIQSKWKENGRTLIQQKRVSGTDSRLFETVSYHQGELHDGENIRSSQTMSGDRLYVIHSSFLPLQSFRVATTQKQKTWEHALKKETNMTLAQAAEKAMKQLSLMKESYYHIYLPELVVYDKRPFGSLTMEQTSVMIGNLWEGLYKNYILGMKTKNGAIVSPVGSTVPLVLIRKDYKHLFVIMETADGQIVWLKQLLEFNE